MNVNGKPEMNALPEPPSDLLVMDVEQLKALSDPLRLEILDVMGHQPRHGWTARELAERLGGKQTKLYHHLRVLEERGFIRVAETRLVSGIVERRYQVAARSIRMSRALLAGSGEDAAGHLMDVVFEKARQEILASIRAGLINMAEEDAGRRRLSVTHGYARLSRASVRKVMRQIERLARFDQQEDPDGDEYGLIVGFYPRATTHDR